MMRFFVSSLFVICQAAEEDALSLLQTRMGANETVEVDHDLDRALAGKGTPPPPTRRRRRRRRAPTPSPTPACNGIKLNQFAGTKFTVSQTSTLYSLAQTQMGVNDSKVDRNLDSTLAGKGGSAPTYTYTIVIGGEIHQQTSDAGNYYLGKHSSYGDMVEYYRNGQGCGGNGPRQADVNFIVGPTLELISAKEPSTCRYQFVVQLPEDHCGLPMTSLDNLEVNEDGEDEEADERSNEEENVHECKKWCYSKKKKNIPWHQYDTPGGARNDPFKCGWFACSTCPECA